MDLKNLFLNLYCIGFSKNSYMKYAAIKLTSIKDKKNAAL